MSNKLKVLRTLVVVSVLVVTSDYLISLDPVIYSYIATLFLCLSLFGLYIQKSISDEDLAEVYLFQTMKCAEDLISIKKNQIRRDNNVEEGDLFHIDPTQIYPIETDDFIIQLPVDTSTGWASGFTPIEFKKLNVKFFGKLNNYWIPPDGDYKVVKSDTYFELCLNIDDENTTFALVRLGDRTCRKIESGIEGMMQSEN